MGNTSQRKLNKALMIALKLGQLDQAEALLQRSADVNGQHRWTMSDINCPALVAIERDDTKMLELLIKYGLDINKPIKYKNYHMPPIMMCMKLKKYRNLKLLAENINIDLNVGGTAVIIKRSIGNNLLWSFSSASAYAQLSADDKSLDIINEAQSVREQKIRAKKQQKIRKAKFGF